MSKNFSSIVKPASKQPYELPKDGQKLPLDGFIGQKKYILPDEEESKVRSALRMVYNVIRYGNAAGMPRLATDKARKQFLGFCALAVTAAVASYGAYKAADAVSNMRQNGPKRALERYLRNVPADQRAAAEAYYNATNDVKMIDYYLSDPVRIKGTYESALLEYYDKDNDGIADIIVGTKVDPELFSGYAEGDVADEVHGSWERYAHPMNGLAIKTSRAGGIIVDIPNGRVVNFSKKNAGQDM